MTLGMIKSNSGGPKNGGGTTKAKPNSLANYFASNTTRYRTIEKPLDSLNNFLEFRLSECCMSPLLRGWRQRSAYSAALTLRCTGSQYVHTIMWVNRLSQPKTHTLTKNDRASRLHSLAL